MCTTDRAIDRGQKEQERGQGERGGETAGVRESREEDRMDGTPFRQCAFIEPTKRAERTEGGKEG